MGETATEPTYIPRRVQYSVTAEDMAALEELRQLFEVTSLANAARLCVRRQLEREGHHLRPCVDVYLPRGRRGQKRQPLRRWSQWLTEDDRDNLQQLARLHGFHRAEAMRYAIRAEAAWQAEFLK